jgi:dephospho-CoA kinase
MTVFGLTGGIGMGKSTAGTLLQKRGVPVVDTDDLAREVVEPGQPALEAVKAAFGPQILDTNGKLRREELARIVFGDASARVRLEAILHPRIAQLWKEETRTWHAQGFASGVVIIPLLFETGAERELDATICIACRPETQRRRLAERGWTQEQIDQRVSAQLSIEEKMKRSDYLVWTEGSLEVFGEQLQRVLG